MPLIAITGGIGAGKSAFTRQLALLAGAESIDTDQCARDLLDHDPEVACDLRKNFGETIFNAGGSVNRAALREAVFKSSERRLTLEAILHPRIRSAWTGWVEERRDGGTILLVEIPLLYETTATGLFDYAIVVGCSRRSQLHRLTEGRQLSLETVERMLASQWTIEEKIARGDFLIWNDGDRAALQTQAALCLTRLPL